MPAPEKSRDAIPLDAISLSEAFERFYRAVVPDWEFLNAIYKKALDSYQKRPANTSAEEWERTYCEWNDAGNRVNDARKRVELAFREAIAAGALTACIRDPVTGQILSPPDRAEWIKKTNFGAPGFNEDFVGLGELVQPGPDTVLHGKMRPAFFLRDDFEKFMGERRRVAEAKNDLHAALDEKRVASFDRFATRQLARGEWVSIPIMIDWLARNDPKQPTPESLFAEIKAELIAGERFKRDGALYVLFLSPVLEPSERRELAAIMAPAIQDADIFKAAVSLFWFPCYLWRGWLESRGYAIPPWLSNREPSPRKITGKKRGRKPKFDWADVEDFIFQRMDARGEFREWDTADNWQGQADLERDVLEYMQKRGDEPGESIVREHVAPALAKWRKIESRKGR